MDEFEKVFERLKAISNTSTQAELADVLHIRQSSISDAKRRNSVPSDWLIKFFDLFGTNPDYLRYGSKPVFLKKNGQYKCSQDVRDVTPNHSFYQTSETKKAPVYLPKCLIYLKIERSVRSESTIYCLPISRSTNLVTYIAI